MVRRFGALARRPPDASTTGVSSLSGSPSAATETDRHYARGVARVGLQVAEALAYAHGQGILHRDIKPSNLLLDREGSVWVADFGLAKAVGGEDLTHTGDIVGTVRYMAPERFQGAGDARSDVYALGLTLYEMLALRPAFDASDRAELIRQVTQEDPPRLRRLNRSVPADLETILHKAIAREPSHRYASAAAMREDLERYLDGRPILARRVSPGERAWRWCRRNPAVAGLLGTVAALLLAGLVGSTWAAFHFRHAAEGERLARQAADASRAVADRARADAQAALSEAEASKAEAERQSKVAEANFARASRAVDDSFTRVSESKLLAVPGLRTLRSELLGSALAFYQELLAERGDDPVLHRELLATRLRVAAILLELGQAQKGRAAYDEAAAGFETALRTNPDDPDLKAGLAKALFARNHLTDEDKLADWRRAIDLREEVQAARPGDSANRRELALVLCDLGSTLLNRNARDAEGIRARSRGASLYLDLAEEAPDDPEITVGLGLAISNTASKLRADSDQRLNLLRQAEALYREALRSRPSDETAPRFLLTTVENLVGSLISLGRIDEATAARRSLVETLRVVARENPETPAVARAFLLATRSLARDLEVRGLKDEAVRALIAPIGAFERLARASGDVIASTAGGRLSFAEQMARLRPDPSPEEKAARDALVDRAIDDYREAFQRGTAVDPASLRSHPLLAEHPRFTALMADVSAAAEARRTGSAAVTSRSGPAAKPAEPLIDAALARPTLLAALSIPLSRVDGARGHEALEFLDRAQAQIDQLARQRPGDADVDRVQAQLGRTRLEVLYARARACLDSQAIADSDAYRSRAEAAYLAYIAEHPRDVHAARARGEGLVALANAHREQGRWPQALRELREARTLLMAALEAAPDEATRQSLLMPVDTLGELFGQMALFDEAADVLARRFRASDETVGYFSYMPFSMALLHLVSGDVPAYRGLAARVIERAVAGREPYFVLEPARVPSLHPAIDPKALQARVARMEEVLAGTPDAFGTWRKTLRERAEFRSGRFAEALRSMKGDVHYSVNWPIRALALHRLGESEEARAWLHKCDARVRDGIERALADKGFRQGGWEWWQDWCDLLIQTRQAHAEIDGREWPDGTWLTLVRARALARAGEAETSDALLAAALAARPEDPEVWLARAQADAWLGRRDAAREHAARAAIGGGPLASWIALGRILKSIGAPNDASAAFDRAATLLRNETPRDENDFIGRVGLWTDMDRPDEASADLAQALERARTASDSKLDMILDRAFERLGPSLHDRQWEQAYQLLRGLRGFVPRASLVDVGLKEGRLSRMVASLLALWGSPDELARHVADLADRLPEALPVGPRAEVLAGMVLAPSPSGLPDRVMALAERTNAEAPTSSAPYLLAAAYLRAGRPEDALKQIADTDRSQPTAGPDRPLFDLVAAIAHQRLGHAEEARRLYDKSIRWSKSQRGQTIPWWPNANLQDALSYEVLRREAEALIVLDPAFPADPFARPSSSR